MDIARLHYMIDQIARNMESRGHDRAVAATADHIAAFWEPRMKAALFASDLSGLSPIARGAVVRLERGATPPPQSSATEFNTVDEIGHSDAG
ncbi:formate dehydrogenase subunit delta [Tsuneonella sp. HG094]